MNGRLISRMAMGLLLAGGLMLAAPSAGAQAPPDRVIRAKTAKYLQIFVTKGIRFEIYYAKKILKYLQTDPARARRLYLSVKPRWDRKLGPHLGVNALGDVGAVARAKRARHWKVLEVTCMKARSVRVADAACRAAVDLYRETHNLKKLKAICQGQSTRSPYYHWRHRNQACKAVSAAGASAGLSAFSGATCQNAVAMFEKHKQGLVSAYSLSKAQKQANFDAVALKLAKCGQWDYIFEKLMHWGGSHGQGRKMLDALHRAGFKLEKLMFAYMKRHRRRLFDFKHAGYALDHWTGYLYDRRMFRNCRKWVKWAYKIPDKVWGNINWFLRNAKCRGAARVAIKRLRSNNARVRKGACVTLGVLGRRRHLRKVRILARTDGYYKWVRRGWRKYRVYPVRDACKAAAGKIQLR